jgi:hypothetical protein
MVVDAARRQQRTAPLALLFTDARGRIVFVDNNFLEMLNYPSATSLVGTPLHKVAGIDASSLSSLMQDVARTGYVHERSLSLNGPGGESINVLCSSVATYNPEGEFIGVDMTFHDAADASLQDDTAPVHGDVLQSRIVQIHAEAEARAKAQADEIEAQARMQAEETEAQAREQADEEQARAAIQAQQRAQEEQILRQLYFTAQVNALQVLLARMGGPRVHATLEDNLNKTASKNRWPIRILGGQITIGDAMPVEGYQGLLHSVVDYGSNVVGRAWMLEEMRAVDMRMDARTREVADHTGLRFSA